MSSRKIGNITFSNESGISMNFTKMSNMQLTPILGGDQASKYYVDSITAIVSITNIGTGAQLYASRNTTTVFLRTINRSINTNVTYDNTYVYTVPDLFYNPYGDILDTTSTPYVPGITYRYSTLGPDGMIYVMSNTSVAIFNPVTNNIDTTSLPFTGTSSNWHKPTLAPNGKIYFPPLTTTNVLVVDTLNRTTDTTTYAKLVLTTGELFIGSTIDTRGRIFCAPSDYTSILIIDTNTGIMDATTYPSVSNNNSSYSAPVLGADGNIYFLPSFESKILIFDTSRNILITNVTISSLFPSTDVKFASGTLSPNGFIYSSPYSDSRFIGINTYTRTITSIRTFGTANQKWSYGIVSPDGKLYFRPTAESRMLIFDPTTLIFDTTTITISPGGQPKRGCTLAPNGKMYFFSDAGTIIMVSSQGTPNQQPEFLYFAGNNH